MIRVIDYGLGNVSAFLSVYKSLRIEAGLARHAAELEDATKLVLPGVGAFDQAMHMLDVSGMRGTLDDLVLGRKLPVLGVCVGMQILALSSEEGKAAGLGWIDAKVKKLRSLSSSDLLLPHMGWNNVQPVAGHPLFSGMAANSLYYFLHSFYFDCARSEDVVAVTDYGLKFSCAVQADNICGVQFHPEKSHLAGVQLLKNFAELAC
ncbi:MAG: imidazole glycerol phosphate synthase subunit HisH [Burkholderiaceae bacterium]